MKRSDNSKDTANKPADGLPELPEAPRESEDTAPASARVPVDPSFSSSSSSHHEIPPLAIRCDGKVLLATTDLADVDLTAREVWTGIVLTEAEASDVHDRLNFEEAASPTAARIRAKKPKKPDSDEE